MKNRIFDLFFSVILLLVASPIILAVAILIKLTSRGPIIFRQERLGQNKIPFIILKFRTLPDDLRNTDAIMTHENQRITAFGKFLRQTHLDELPQLWNVIKGDMRLTGPRPLTESLVYKRKQVVPTYDNRFVVKPGLTGLLQIRGRVEEWTRGPSKSLRLEMFYIRKQNLMFDLRILFRTAVVMLKRKGI